MKRFIIPFVCSLFLTAYSFAQEVKPTPITTIEFQKTEHDFGTIYQGDVAKVEYSFANTGSEPLVLTNAKGSCGCTVPQWPKEPIMPGETSVIKVEFNSKGKKGIQSKRVTLTANTDPVQTYLVIKGEVLVDETEEAVIGLDEGRTIASNDLKKLNAKDCFAIFPNPTTDVLKLDLKEYLGESADIKILNSNGSIVATKKINNIRRVVEFQVANYAAGTYYVNIQVGNTTPSTKCFVVAKR